MLVRLSASLALAQSGRPRLSEKTYSLPPASLAVAVEHLHGFDRQFLTVLRPRSFGDRPCTVLDADLIPSGTENVFRSGSRPYAEQARQGCWVRLLVRSDP